jgi:hypothetical protein
MEIRRFREEFALAIQDSIELEPLALPALLHVPLVHPVPLVAKPALMLIRQLQEEPALVIQAIT